MTGEILLVVRRPFWLQGLQDAPHLGLCLSTQLFLTHAAHPSFSDPLCPPAPSPPLTQFFLECGGLVRTDKKPALCKSYQKLVSEVWHKKR